jgi:class 3 adenylate cyclase
MSDTVPSASFTRRLRAVMVVDVVAYSRLMAADEARTHTRVNALFATVVDPTIEAHAGRRIERAGDGLIVLFESSTDAVRCAL